MFSAKKGGLVLEERAGFFRQKGGGEYGRDLHSSPQGENWRGLNKSQGCGPKTAGLQSGAKKTRIMGENRVSQQQGR